MSFFIRAMFEMLKGIDGMLKGLSGRVPPRSRWSAKALFKKAL
jgi:hypothetical protein